MNRNQSNGFYDVIVAGSGPAGASAAYFLGEAGKRVLVLEKETLPRYKTCGGGISSDFLRQQFPFSFEPVLKTRVDGFSYAFGGRMFTVPVQPGVVGMVMRDQMDAYILEHARADLVEGAAVRSVIESETEVTVETRDGKRYTAPYLIAADGANSAVAHALGLRRKQRMAGAIEAEVRVSPDLMRQYGSRPVFIFGEIRSGYLWIFPKPDHLSVGIAALRPGPGILQRTLFKVMARYGISLDNVPLHGHPIPLYARRDAIATRRTLLAGDAAGLADPLSGEGIRYSIKSGRLAAQAIINGRPENYEREVFRQIGLHHSQAVLVARIFYALEGLCLWLGAPNPFTTRVLVEMLSDRASTADVFFTAVATLPVYLATEAAAHLAGLLGGKDLGDRLRAEVYQ